MSSTTHRIFVAVPVDAAILRALADLERALEAAGATLRWVKPENLHFTLRFLGHITDAQVRRVQVAAREAAGAVAPFGITLAGVGAFPTPRRPQVVWVGVGKGAEQLAALASSLDDSLARQRFAREPQGFHPHLTLARVKEPRLWGSLGPVLAEFESVEVGDQVVTSLLVMESLLGPQGPTYTPVEEVPLRDHEK